MMLGRLIALCLAVIVTAAGLAASAAAQSIAVAVAVAPGADVTVPGGKTALKSGAPLASGDVVTTDRTGSAQLRFTDGTRIVVGPGSRLVIDAVLMQSGGTAQRFAVSAVGGTFRFLSGRSPKENYTITTPTATMGIRGTGFDFSVDPARGTNVVLFRGEVRFCLKVGNCAALRGNCTLLLSDRSRITGKDSVDQKKAILREQFPYVVDQENLVADFKAATGSCGDVVKRPRVTRERGDRGERGSGGNEPPAP